MAYSDLRDFMAQLEATGDLRCVAEPVSPHLEMTALSDRVLRAGGPALLFTQPMGHRMPVLTNLFGTTDRVARAMGVADLHGVRALGELLATLKEPEAPKGFKDMLGMGQLLKTLWNMAPHTVARGAPCQQEVWEGPDVDLARRGGALDFADHCAAHPGQPYPVAVALGADPATLLGAVTPVPDALSEYQFAGLLRGARTEVTPALGVPLSVPATAEIVLEGHIQPDAGHPSGWQHALEGPYGDHTGYYNECAEFPVLTV